MEIRTISHIGARSAVSIAPNVYDAICITRPGEFVPSGINLFTKDVLILSFDDIDCPLKGYVMPSTNDVSRAIDFAKHRQNLIITCTSGDTHSPALDYLIRCTRSKPYEAIRTIRPYQHPNRAIIEIGAKLLENPEIMEVYKGWKRVPPNF